MSRPLRIEYPGAWHHIMNRGGRYEAIFEDKIDYSVFLDLLRETIEIFHIKVSAFYTTRGAAFRALHQFQNAILCAKAALNFSLTVGEG